MQPEMSLQRRLEILVFPIATARAKLKISSGMDKKRGIVGYLRFLYIFMLSRSVTYWNPFSMSSLSSSIVWATLTVYSSSSLKCMSCV